MLRNITLSADEQIIEQARKKARSRHETLNTAFRQWLLSYAEKTTTSNYLQIMQQLKYVKSGTHFTRDELNER